ncbi:MAG: NYN domain-containing protein [Nitrospiraceae bacterium]|nr:NYN domain-containing protein [Nitrospiraceae bacterium]
MACIIIDGYNVIGVMHRDIEASRKSFIEFLIAYSQKSGNEVTVVFDGYKSGSQFEETMVTGGVRVIYSRLNEKADDVIKRIISEDRREWIVVSSDRAIVNHAWSVKSIPIDSDVFYRMAAARLDASSHAAADYEEEDFSKDDDDDEYESPQRGNPRRLSKKGRLIRRGLSWI